MGTLLVLDTDDGLRAAATGTCRVCSHSDVGLYLPVEREGAGYTFDASAAIACPHCDAADAFELRPIDKNDGPQPDAGTAVDLDPLRVEAFLARRRAARDGR